MSVITARCGEEDVPGRLREREDRSIFRHGLLGLQDAIDRQAVTLMEVLYRTMLDEFIGQAQTLNTRPKSPVLAEF
jgi:hypothetical protein